jgi:AraC family transcriptional regulator
MVQLESGKFLGANKNAWKINGINISTTEYASKVFEGWHSHEDSHFSLIVQGGNREQRRNHEIEAVPGKILFYHSGELHRNVNTEHPSKNINVGFEQSFFSKYGIDFADFKFSSVHQPEAQFALIKIYRECVTNDGVSELCIHGLMLSLLTKRLPYHVNPLDSKWALLRTILNDRWNESLSLNQLASMVNVHPVTISKVFPKLFGCTLGEYIRKIRIEKAISLIWKNPSDSLTSVAHHCGFYDQSHFIKVFRQTTGFLPNEFKNIQG